MFNPIKSLTQFIDARPSRTALLSHLGKLDTQVKKTEGGWVCRVVEKTTGQEVAEIGSVYATHEVASACAEGWEGAKMQFAAIRRSQISALNKAIRQAAAEKLASEKEEAAKFAEHTQTASVADLMKKPA